MNWLDPKKLTIFLIIVDLLIAIGYFKDKDIRMAFYWVFAAGITFTATKW